MKPDMKFFGSVTIGERGQIVIPADARGELKMKPGDKLLVFKSWMDGAFLVAKPEEFERHVQRMSHHASELQQKIKEETNNS